MSPKCVGFIEAIKLYFQNYINFSARSTRSEYWWICLFNIIIYAFSITLITTADSIASFIVCVWVLYMLATFIPSLSLLVRRLHDIGYAGTWVFIGIIPIIGGIILFLLTISASGESNKWGNPADGASPDTGITYGGAKE
ncbi:MAG: DUF805 domain-containing protein [Treponema sp.]|nr:DUF805 domain-containing protein [Treponema sp.]